MKKYFVLYLMILISVNSLIYGELNFVVMGDNRPADIFRPEQPYVYYKVVEQATALNPVIILNTGDLILGYNAHSTDKATEEFDDFDNASEKIKNFPLYITMGNHTGYSEYARAIFKQRYGYGDDKRLYYSVDISGENEDCHFIILNSELEDEQSQITGDQLEWLKKDLEAAKGKHIFVLVHRPLYPRIKHLTDSLNEYPTLRDELAALLKAYDVRMVFCGHVHIYNYLIANGLPQIIAGGSGAPPAAPVNDGGFYHFFNVVVDNDTVEYKLIPVTDETSLAGELLQGNYIEGAIAMAQKAGDFLPEHPVPYIILGTAYTMQKNKAHAKKTIARLTTILGSKANAYFRMAEYAQSIGIYKTAGSFYQQALKLDDQSFAVIYNYALYNQAINNKKTALEYFKKALSLTDDAFFIKEINEAIKTLSN